jgi:hypothetical protein
MNATQKFIEDAIEGGWWKTEYDTEPVDTQYYRFFLSSPLLDPLAWQAVGKTRGWDSRTTFYQMFTKVNKENNDPWRLDMHRFIDHLADGKSIEEALAEIAE